MNNSEFHDSFENTNTQPAINPTVNGNPVQEVPVIRPDMGANPSVSPAIATPNSPELLEPINSPSNPPELLEPIGGSGNNGTGNEEHLKKVEINYTPPSKAKMVLLVLFFIALIAFVLFLPDITSLVNQYKSNKGEVVEEKVTTGKLYCSLSTSTTNLDKDYDLTFRFTDNQLEKTEFTITTRGDATLDETALDTLAATCMELSEESEEINGVTIKCNYSNGKLVETQNYDLANLDSEKLDAAFTEAGGNNPEYQYGQDVDQIERTMNAAGYTCKREK